MKKKELIWIIEKMARFINHGAGCSSMEIKHSYVDGKIYKIRRETAGKCDCGYEQLVEEINDMEIFIKER